MIMKVKSLFLAIVLIAKLIFVPLICKAQGMPETNSVSDKSICFGQSVVIGNTAIKGIKYSWEPSHGLNSPNLPQPSASPDSTTIYYVTQIDSILNTQTTYSVKVTVHPLPKANTGSDMEVCFGSKVLIGSNTIPGNTYLWSPSVGLTSPSESKTTAYPGITTTYILTETVSSTGCKNSNNVTIRVNPNPDANIGLKEIQGLNYCWTTRNNQVISTNARLSTAPTKTTSYHLIVKNALTGCQNTNFLTVNVFQIPQTYTKVASSDLPHNYERMTRIEPLR
jgi:hypothetical protein